MLENNFSLRFRHFYTKLKATTTNNNFWCRVVYRLICNTTVNNLDAGHPFTPYAGIGSTPPIIPLYLRRYACSSLELINKQ